MSVVKPLSQSVGKVKQGVDGAVDKEPAQQVVHRRVVKGAGDPMTAILPRGHAPCGRVA